MPGLVQNSTPFNQIQVIPLHPTFAAEVRGVNFQNVDQETLAEVQNAMAQVTTLLQPRVAVF